MPFVIICNSVNICNSFLNLQYALWYTKIIRKTNTKIMVFIIYGRQVIIIAIIRQRKKENTNPKRKKNCGHYYTWDPIVIYRDTHSNIIFFLIQNNTIYNILHPILSAFLERFLTLYAERCTIRAEWTVSFTKESKRTKGGSLWEGDDAWKLYHEQRE